MNFAQSLQYLNSFLNFEKIHFQPRGREWSLERMNLLLKRAGYPQKNYERVLIAGTKGKGSTGFFLESMLENSGIKTGFYSSPHLVDPRERIRVGGKMISRNDFARAMTWARGIISGGKSFTYFEVMTLMAAWHFKNAGVKVGIFEVGMGGRLDATNALGHGLSILTPVHLDHEAVLGNTIAKIAGEKAAIIRSRSEVVTGPQVPEAMKVIRARARQRKAVLIQARPFKGNPGLPGDFQKANAGVAVEAAGLLARKLGFRLSCQPLYKKVWPGRMEWLQDGQVLIDGAHNPVSVQALARNLKFMGIKDPVLVFGTSRDKNSAQMLRILSKIAQEIVLTPLPGPRTQQIGTLLMQANEHFPLVFPAADAREAMKLARQRAKGRKIVVTGSFYLIGQVRSKSNA